MKLKAAVVAAMMVPGVAGAQVLSGNDLLPNCNGAGEQMAFCTAYVIGSFEGMKYGTAAPFMTLDDHSVTELNTLVDSVLGYCTPDEATYAQHVAVAVKYMNNNPAITHYPARQLIHMAFVEAFPCP